MIGRIVRLKETIRQELKSNKYFYFVIFFALLSMAAIFLIFGFQKHEDTTTYISIIHWFSDPSLSSFPTRIIEFLLGILRPISPLLAVPFQFLGDGAGLIVQNSIFYLLIAILIFKITDLIFQNKKQAFYASIFFMAAPPILETGLSYMTDTGSLFFYVLSLYLTLLYFKSGKESLIPINGFLSGFGILMKETGGIGIIFFIIMILLSKRFIIREKILKITRFTTFFLLPVLVWNAILFYSFRYSHFHHYLFMKTRYLDVKGFQIYIDHFVSLFGSIEIIGWILAVFGVYWLWRRRDLEKLKIFFAMLPTSLSFILWPANDFRLGLVFVPLGVILASTGLVLLEEKFRIKKKFLVILIILSYVIINYYFYSIRDFIPFIDLKDIF